MAMASWNCKRMFFKKGKLKSREGPSKPDMSHTRTHTYTHTGDTFLFVQLRLATVAHSHGIGQHPAPSPLPKHMMTIKFPIGILGTQ